MVPIPIDEFINGIRTPVDLHVKLSSSKYILLAKAGAQTQREQLSSYQNKEVNYLWVKREEYHKVTKQNVEIAGIVVTKSQLTSGQKSQILGNAASSVFKELEFTGVTNDSYERARQVTDATLVFVESHNDLYRLLKSLNKCADELLRHSLAVSSLSVIIARAQGWNSKPTLEKLALGGLLHDIGKKSLPQELIVKPTFAMNNEELQLYETHAYRGMQLLQGLGGIVPDDIVSIVYEHHENAFGQGFPRRLRDLKIHPLARVVALADAFVNLTFKGPQCPHPKQPRDAVKYIDATMGQPFNKAAFLALQKVIETGKVKAA